mmetsp:Transcript_10364/g.28333  ORF Transcript_10364/g.28333 Transcript_10364/m.28333 type:complete len:211 (+) Transcript_10364:489-1121(+)
MRRQPCGKQAACRASLMSSSFPSSPDLQGRAVPINCLTLRGLQGSDFRRYMSVYSALRPGPSQTLVRLGSQLVHTMDKQAIVNMMARRQGPPQSTVLSMKATIATPKQPCRMKARSPSLSLYLTLAPFPSLSKSVTGRAFCHEHCSHSPFPGTTLSLRRASSWLEEPWPACSTQAPNPRTLTSSWWCPRSEATHPRILQKQNGGMRRRGW